jgi:hypothetical protein
MEIPTVESDDMDDTPAVEVQIREDGEADITRLSDIYFPAYWRGQNVLDSLPFGPDDQSVPVRVEAREPFGEDWFTIHYGFLRKIGSGGDGRLLRMRVDDYSKVLSGIPIDKRFGGEEYSTSEDVVAVVEDKLEDNGFNVSVDATNVDLLETKDTGTPSSSPASKTPGVDATYLYKTFQENRDTLTDVMNWLADAVDGYWWIEYGDREPTIVLTTDVGERFSATNVDTDTPSTDVYVTKNLAMEEISPVNTVTVTGRSAATVFGIDVPLPALVSESYPVATATHDVLIDRADGTALQRRIEVDATTEEEAEKRARKELEKRIEGAAEGKIVLDGEPTILPYDTVSAKPLCGDFIEADVDPITYSVERVTHRLPTTERWGTVIDVGIPVSAEDITTISSTVNGRGTSVDPGAAASGESFIEGSSYR